VVLDDGGVLGVEVPELFDFLRERIGRELLRRSGAKGETEAREGWQQGEARAWRGLARIGHAWVAWLVFGLSTPSYL
jgi:hypothetical protein